MKCPHCKKPVHVRALTLDKGRRPMVLPRSTQVKAETASKHLASLIEHMNKVQGHSFGLIGSIMGVSAERPGQFVRREREKGDDDSGR